MIGLGDLAEPESDLLTPHRSIDRQLARASRIALPLGTSDRPVAVPAGSDRPWSDPELTPQRARARGKLVLMGKDWHRHAENGSGIT